MDFENLTEDQLRALEELGEELEKVSWQPETIPMKPYGLGKKISNAKLLAINYVNENREEMQKHVCKDNAVKIEIQAAGASTATVADAFQAMAGAPIPVWNLANVVCMLGLGKFCQWKAK